MKQLSKWLCVVAIVFIAVVSCSTKSSGMKLIPVKSGDKWGYVNSKGEYVINPQFDEAFPFSDGVGIVVNDGKVGYINEDGSFLFSTMYKEGTPFRDGLAIVVSEGSAPTCIDKNGNVKFTMNDAEIMLLFSEGMAAYGDKDGLYGYVDKTGTIVINPQFNYGDVFVKGFASVASWSDDGIRCDYGFINKTGNFVVNPQFKRVRTFSEDISAVWNGKEWGFIDSQGAFALNPQFKMAGNFNEGLAKVSFDGIDREKGFRYGYINKTGKIVINPQFYDAGDFSNGLAVIEQEDGNWGYVDKNGKIVITPQFEEATIFFDDFAIVKSAGKYGFIDKNGKFVVNPQFDDVHYLTDKEHYFVNPVNPTFSFVNSDYYDVSTFLTNFFNLRKGGYFENLKPETTLQTLVESEQYGNCLNYNRYSGVFCNKNMPLDENILITNVSFDFEEEVYSEVSGYNYSAKLAGIWYKIKLKGDAEDRSQILMKALRDKFEQVYNKNLFTDGDSGPFFSEAGKGSEAIMIIEGSEESTLNIFIGVSDEALETLGNAYRSYSNYINMMNETDDE